MLKDDGFKLSAVPATTALKAAECFLKWEAENKSIFEIFALETAKVLRHAFILGGRATKQQEKGRGPNTIIKNNYLKHTTNYSECNWVLFYRVVLTVCIRQAV